MGYLINSTANLVNSSFVCSINTSTSYAVGHLILGNYSVITFDNMSNNGTLNATVNYTSSFIGFIYYSTLIATNSVSNTSIRSLYYSSGLLVNCYDSNITISNFTTNGAIDSSFGSINGSKYVASTVAFASNGSNLYLCNITSTANIFATNMYAGIIAYMYDIFIQINNT